MRGTAVGSVTAVGTQVALVLHVRRGRQLGRVVGRGRGSSGGRAGEVGRSTQRGNGRRGNRCCTGEGRRSQRRKALILYIRRSRQFGRVVVGGGGLTGGRAREVGSSTQGGHSRCGNRRRTCEGRR